MFKPHAQTIQLMPPAHETNTRPTRTSTSVAYRVLVSVAWGKRLTLSKNCVINYECSFIWNVTQYIFCCFGGRGGQWGGGRNPKKFSIGTWNEPLKQPGKYQKFDKVFFCPPSFGRCHFSWTSGNDVVACICLSLMSFTGDWGLADVVLVTRHIGRIHCRRENPELRGCLLNGAMVYYSMVFFRKFSLANRWSFVWNYFAMIKFRK